MNSAMPELYGGLIVGAGVAANLLVFYVAQWAVIGAAFRVEARGGFAVLGSYFITLAATTFSYRRVGHGAPRDAGR